jgi:glyoxylase-like metal-dependent hydrolase (beta-lactamase superfamily II)
VTVHQLYALKFAEVRQGSMAQYFLNPPASCADQAGHMDFMLWVIRTAWGDVAVDAGFTAEVARRRGRPHFRAPSEALRLLGVDPSTVRHVILTHLHFDHCGDLAPFQTADFYVQAAEMAFWTSPIAARGEFRRLVEPEDLQRLVRLNLDGRVVQVVGDREVVPGVTVHHVGGHTPGMQVVSVRTERGTAVLASDASHLLAHIHEDAPAKFVTDLPRMYQAFDRIRELASDPDLIVPGHDAQVFERYEPVDGLTGIAVRIA